jgi:enoyl-CoA hydratase
LYRLDVENKMNSVKYSVHGPVALMTLNRPEKKNAVDPEMANELEAAIDRLEADPAVRAGILRAEYGEGRPVFCAGHDLKHFLEFFGQPEEDEVTTIRGGFAGLARRERTKPLIAAVDGLATSGGCEMALACDIVIASSRAAFALAEVKWNLMATAGGAFRLPRIVGRFVAADALLTGDEISGERAYQLGLVSRLADHGKVDELAMQLALSICKNGPRAVQLVRKVAECADAVDDEAAWKMLDEAANELRNSADLQEGLRSFMEKRAPRWTGK